MKNALDVGIADLKLGVSKITNLSVIDASKMYMEKEK